MVDKLRKSGLLAVVAVTLAVAFSLVGCAAPTDGGNAGTTLPAPRETGFPITVLDDAGREVEIASEPMRIVSLAPSNTEIVYALGILERLVGVTTFDDYPAQVAQIDKVGDFITPNLEAIAALEPDLVLATTGIQSDVIEQIEAMGAVVVAIDPQTLEALFTSIQTVGDATGQGAAAEEVVAGMQADLGEITSAIGEREPVRCFVEISQNPLFTAGADTLLNDLISAAGGQNVITVPGFGAYSLEQIVTDDPEVYLATKGSMSDPADLAKRPGFANLAAVRNDRVYVLDDNLVSRPGPRVVQGVRQIAEALHPDAFQ